jgi:hypothetical protein
VAHGFKLDFNAKAQRGKDAKLKRHDVGARGARRSRRFTVTSAEGQESLTDLSNSSLKRAEARAPRLAPLHLCAFALKIVLMILI